jgi:ADP-ribosyl-[dinitrogen reductase] hydrolase
MDADNSVTSPLRISAVKVAGTGGLIGMTECPGMNEHPGLGIPVGPWRRDLDRDLRAMLDWQAQVLVSLIEDHEFELLDVSELPRKAVALGLRWMHLPIAEGCLPDSRFEKGWDSVGQELRQLLAEGGRIVLHGRRGVGRSGTIAARLLVEFGMTPCAAFAAVRQARPGAIPSLDEENYVRGCRRG